MQQCPVSMNVARAYPARRQADGTIWYRSAPDTANGTMPGMGWTSYLAHAHADYRAPDAPAPIPFDDRNLIGDPDLSVAGPAVAKVIGEALDAAELFTTAEPLPSPRAGMIEFNGEYADEQLRDNPYTDLMRNAVVTSPDEYRWTPEQASGNSNAAEHIITTTTTEEPPPVTALTEDFEEYNPPRFTEWMHYPLPPAPPRAVVKHGAWGWYRLPSPTTGRPTGFPRATTIADTLDDTYGLNRWKRRETAMRIYQLSQMPPDTLLNPYWDTTAGEALEMLVKAMNGTKVTGIDTVLDVIDNLLGGAESRELGECVHAWIEALALGTVLYRDVPDLVRPHIDAARKVMAHRGMFARPEYVERVVLNDQGEETVAGRIDCIWEIITADELVLGDVKTSKDLKYSWLSFGVQIGGVYGWATKMLTTDGRGWEPMPEINTTYAILLHVPSDQPERAAAITIDMNWGGEVMVESLATRRRRKEAPKEVPKHALPAPSDTALRIVAARLALSTITSLEQGQAVYETYQDVWNDSLEEFGATIAELL